MRRRQIAWRDGGRLERLNRVLAVYHEVAFSPSNLPKAGIIHRRAEYRAGESRENWRRKLEGCGLWGVE